MTTGFQWIRKHRGQLLIMDSKISTLFCPKSLKVIMKEVDLDLDLPIIIQKLQQFTVLQILKQLFHIRDLWNKNKMEKKQTSKIAAWYFNAELDQGNTPNTPNLFGQLSLIKILDHMELLLD